MKKVIALVMATLCIFSVFCIGAYAADEYISPEESVKIISGTKTPGGKVNPPSSTYKPGDDVLFHITPDKGYRIKQVWVNGVAIGPVSEYLFKNIQVDSTIYAEFERIPEEPTEPTTQPGKKDTKPVSPSTGNNLEVIVLCVLSVAFFGGIAAVSVIRKGRKEEY